jgi:hypothetical protein
VVLAVFILFDLSAFNWVEVNNNAVTKAGDQYEQMISLGAPARFIKAQPGLHRVRVNLDPEPNIGDIYGVQSVWGGGATTLTSYAKLGLQDNLLNVRYSIRSAAAPDPNPVYRDARWKVYKNPNAFPRAWFVHKSVVESSSDAAFRRLADPAIDLHTTAILDAPLRTALDGTAGTEESVRFRSYEADRMAIDIDSGKPALLVLSEMYYPGWRATVNGKPAEILKVDGALRGILVPAGPGRVDLEYAPFSFYAGAAVSLVTFGAVLAGLVVELKRPGRQPL